MIDTQALYAQQSEVTHALERDSIIRQSTALHIAMQYLFDDLRHLCQVRSDRGRIRLVLWPY